MDSNRIRACLPHSREPSPLKLPSREADAKRTQLQSPQLTLLGALRHPVPVFLLLFGAQKPEQQKIMERSSGSPSQSLQAPAAVISHENKVMQYDPDGK